MYVFDREVLEGMLREEQQRIQKDLEKFAEKLKGLGVSFCDLAFIPSCTTVTAQLCCARLTCQAC